MQVTLNKTSKKRDRLAKMWDDLLTDSVAPEPPGKERLTLSTSLEADPPVSYRPGPDPQTPLMFSLTDRLKSFFSTLVEPANMAPVPVSLEAPNPAGEAPSPMTLEAAHEESLSYSTPFRWDPKPAWISAPVQFNPRPPGLTDIERLVFKPKIPLRPLHKQPFYRRFFFYLRGWLSRRFRQTA